MKKISTHLIKEINLSNVRRVMKDIEIGTKPQIAELTQLSVVTINSLIKDLVEQGEIAEDKMIPSNGGRPALTYRYNYDFSMALVIYMNVKQGKDTISASVLNLREDILEKQEYHMPIFERTSFYEMIGYYLARYPAIKVIGVGIPGQAVDGQIIVSSHPNLQGVRMSEDIQSHFGIPVVLENDINAAITGYYVKHDSPQDQCIVGMYFPEKYCPGMGIHLNGQLIKGKQGMAGEIKFLPIEIDWESDLSKETFIETLCQLVQTTNAILAPQQIIMYQSYIQEAEWHPYWEAYQLKRSMPSYPELIFLDSFHQDFEVGMKWLTLKALEPFLSHIPNI